MKQGCQEQDGCHNCGHSYSTGDETDHELICLEGVAKDQVPKDPYHFEAWVGDYQETFRKWRQFTEDKEVVEWGTCGKWKRS